MTFSIPNKPANSSAMQEAQASPDSTDFAILAAADAGIGVVSGCGVTWVSGMSYSVAAGVVATGSKARVTLPAAVTVTHAAADATNPRFDLIAVSVTGAVVVRAGTAAAICVFPPLVTGDVVLGAVFVPAGAAALAQANFVSKAVAVAATASRFNALDYGLVPARRFTDAATTGGSTTITSASAAFTASDVGRQVYLCGDFFSSKGFVTLVASVTNATTLVLAHAPATTRTGVEVYIGDPQQAAIQSAIDAAAAAGGGRVELPEGAYPITDRLVLKTRVVLAGQGKRATTLWLGMLSATVGVGDTMILNLRGDATAGGSAMFIGVRDLLLDGGKERQVNTTTLTAAVAAGDMTITVASTANFPAATVASPAALMLTNGGTREVVYYTAKTATTFTVMPVQAVGLAYGGRNREQSGSAGVAFAIAGTTVGTHGHGIWFHVNPLAPLNKPALDDDYDVHALTHNVMIESPLGDGYNGDGRATSRIYDTHVYRAGKNGFNPGTDIMLVSCESGESCYEGFYIHGDSVNIVNCKSFYSGTVTGGFGNAGRGYGFYLNYARFANLANCYAQDNKYSGFMFDGTISSVLVGCVADSNNVVAANGGTGFDFYAAYNNLLAGCVAVDRNNAGVTTQTNGLRLRGGSTGNAVQMTHKGASGATVAAPVITDVVGAVDSNNLIINGMGSSQAIPWAATITPDPYAYTVGSVTLAGATTIANPTYAHKNQQLTLTITQDATGGRAITWGSQFVRTWLPNTRPNRRDTITFVFDGANWNQTSAMPSLQRAQTSVQAGDTITAAALTNFASGTYTIPANTLAVGQTLRITARGVWGQGTTANSWTPTVRVGVSGTTLLKVGTATALPISQTNASWELEVMIVIVAIGATGAAEVQGRATFFPASSTAITTVPMISTATVTLDTTVSNVLTLASTWSATTGVPTITLRQFIVEALDQ